MLTNKDIEWVESRGHDWTWDNSTASRAEWERRNAEVVQRMREAQEAQFRLQGLEK